MKSKVIVLDTEELDKAVERIWSEIGPDVSGKRVLVKPNMLGGYHPDSGVVTHPELVKAVVEFLLREGAEVTVGDNPGGVPGPGKEPDSVAKRCGIYDASLGCFKNIGSDPVEVEIGSRFVSKVIVSRAVLEADVVVNLPVFKTHNLTIITGSIKNMFGIIPGAFKVRLHALAPSARMFSELLVDIYSIRIPEINIMDAITIMDGSGPSGGRVRPFGKLIAGADGVAVDSVMAYMMGLEPKEVPMIEIGRERGLGNGDLSMIDIEGMAYRIRDFEVPSPFISSVSGFFNRFYEFVRVVPILIEGRCTRCGACSRSCPMGAITMNPYPEMDRRLCISCFCCAEICEKGAIRIPKVWEDLLRRAHLGFLIKGGRA
jgi:uncharacterized protein (DUF362 family)/NAD-dependent dihydropyrimidine dehydrogenase PreA subunit